MTFRLAVTDEQGHTKLLPNHEYNSREEAAAVSRALRIATYPRIRVYDTETEKWIR